MKTKLINSKSIKTSIMKKNMLKLAFAIVLVSSFISCNEDDDAPRIINEEELITTVEYTLVNDADASNVVVFNSEDSDGPDGPNPPNNIVTGMIQSGATYTGSVLFLNKTEFPAEDITEEVQEEDEDHEVFYLSPLTGLQIDKLDRDPNGNPLGLRTSFTASAAGMSNLTIVLRHLPNKPNDGTLTNAGGDTDTEVTFTFTVQ